MEVLHILMWSVIFVAAIGLAVIAKPLADILFPRPEEKTKKNKGYKETWDVKEE